MPEAREWELVVPRMAPATPAPPSFLTAPPASAAWARHLPYVLPGIVTLCLGIATWRVLEVRGAQIAPPENEWVTGRIAPDRVLTLHRSFLHSADYQFEFTANLERGVACVLRTVNSKNYYVLNLEPDGAG